MTLSIVFFCSFMATWCQSFVEKTFRTLWLVAVSQRPSPLKAIFEAALSPSVRWTSSLKITRHVFVSHTRAEPSTVVVATNRALGLTATSRTPAPCCSRSHSAPVARSQRSSRSAALMSHLPAGANVTVGRLSLAPSERIRPTGWNFLRPRSACQMTNSSPDPLVATRLASELTATIGLLPKPSLSVTLNFCSASDGATDRNPVLSASQRPSPLNERK